MYIIFSVNQQFPTIQTLHPVYPGARGLLPVVLVPVYPDVPLTRTESMIWRRLSYHDLC